MNKRHSNLGCFDQNSYDSPQLISVSGGYCSIMLSKFNIRANTSSVIIKFLKPDISVRWLLREMYILKRLKHKNVVNYIGHTHHKLFGYGLVLEHMECGDLHGIVVDSSFKYSWKQVGSWSGQLLLALDYLENRGIVHSDLNTKNILLKNDHDIVKIADFGSARRPHEKMITQNMFHYCNPSFFTGEPLTSKSDMFAFGMVLWWMLYRRDPFYGIDPISCNYLLLNGIRPRTGDSNRLEQMCHSCWAEDPDHRKSAALILQEFYRTS